MLYLAVSNAFAVIYLLLYVTHFSCTGRIVLLCIGYNLPPLNLCWHFVDVNGVEDVSLLEDTGKAIYWLIASLMLTRYIV